MNRTLKYILIASLLLNVLCIGLLVGTTGKKHWKGFRQGQHMQQQLTEYISPLPDAEQKQFQERITALREENKRSMQQVKGLRREVLETLKTEPFNASLYDAKIAEMTALHQTMRNRQSALIRDIAQRLTAEERIKLAESLMKHGKRRERK